MGEPMSRPLNLALFLPPNKEKPSEIEETITRITAAVRRRFPPQKVLFSDIRDKKDYSSAFVGGIACGDAALDQINSEYFGKIPILALSGKPMLTSIVKEETTRGRQTSEIKRFALRKGVYPLLPSPDVSGFLLARAVLSSWAQLSEKDQNKKLKIALLSIKHGDDSRNERFPVFKQTLKAHIKNAQIEDIPFSFKDKDDAEKIDKKLKDPFNGMIDFIACHGYGKTSDSRNPKSYDEVIEELVNRNKAATFWCDYNYSPKYSPEEAINPERERPQERKRIQCIGLKNCFGTNVFVEMACAGADILQTAFQENPPSENPLACFADWVSQKTFFPSAIGPLWFIQSDEDKQNQTFTLRHTFYRTTDYKTSPTGFLPLDFNSSEDVIPAENLIDFLDAEDKTIVEWQGKNNSPEELLTQVTEALKNQFHDGIRVFSFWPGQKVAPVDAQDSSVLPWWKKSSAFDTMRSILAGCREKKAHVVQVNLDYDDMEDNGVSRLYARRANFPCVPVLAHILSEGGDYDNQEVMIGQNAQDATISFENKSGEVLQKLEVIHSEWAKDSEHQQTFLPRYIYLLDCTPNEISGTNRESASQWGAIVLTSEKLNAEKVKIVHQVFKSAYSAIMLQQEKEHARQAQLQSAIGSIMARNGSHNIGSHVLAALSHNVGTMPDDRVLYQYIQHRMDYIATAASELPQWTVPTMFVGEIMRSFFIQRHLLDHIAESEGLHAYYFQGHEEKSNKTGTIRFFVRRLVPDAFDDKQNILHSSQRVRCEFVLFNDQASKSDEESTGLPDHAVFDDDVRLAIPAGVIGNHAIYTIIENILRNVAKHERLKKEANLEISIGFIDDAEKDYSEFFIWNKSLGKDRKSVEERVKSIKEKLNAPFIDENGQLRREDWGLAEMKISAGILQRRSIAEIGGLGDTSSVAGTEWEGKEIISPILVESAEKDAFHLGYRFFVPKPKEFLFIFPKRLEISSKIVQLLRKQGIHIAFDFGRDENGEANCKLETVSDKGQNLLVQKQVKIFNYSFVILPPSAIEQARIKSDHFPFRVMVWKGVECADGESNNTEKTILFWDHDGDERALIPTMDIKDVLLKISKLHNMLPIHDGNRDEFLKIIDEVKDSIYKRWLEYLEAKTRAHDQARRKLKVLVNVDGEDSDGTSGRSLISDIDVWKFVFKNLFRSTLRAFCRQNMCVAEAMAPTFFALYMMNFESIDIESAGFVSRDDESQTNNMEKLRVFLAQTIPEMVQESVRETLTSTWLYNKFLHLANPDDGDLRYVLQKLKLVDKQSAEVKAIEKQLSGLAKRDIKEQFKDTRAVEDFPFEDGFDTLVRYFENHLSSDGNKLKIPALDDDALDGVTQSLLNAYHAADVMLRKYSEQIATLPKIYSADRENGDKVEELAKPFGKRLGVELRFAPDTNNTPIVYYRHGTDRDCSIYKEGLSGSQSSMMQMQAFVREPNASFLCRLTESALVRVLIVDERFYRFLSNRKETVSKLAWMNVWAVNTDVLLASNGQSATTGKQDGHIGMASHKSCSALEISEDYLKKGDIPDGKFDIIIVHQGVIDKLLGNASTSAVSRLLENLKKHVPYVVVTTGRGIPANIPPSARVLPFSSIERHLFQEYPEKVLLVNTLMSLLPCRRS